MWASDEAAFLKSAESHWREVELAGKRNSMRPTATRTTSRRKILTSGVATVLQAVTTEIGLVGVSGSLVPLPHQTARSE